MNDPTIITPTMRARADFLALAMWHVSGYDPRLRTRARAVSVGRMIVCDQLMQEGWTEHAVGTVFGIDHSAVNYYRRRMRDVQDLPGYDAERDLLAAFRELLKP